jgi:hypothetical protein
MDDADKSDKCPNFAQTGKGKSNPKNAVYHSTAL